MLSRIRELIEQHFESQWALLANGIEIDWDGTRETRLAPFVRLVIVPGASENIGLNEPPTRNGVVSVMIFTKTNTGMGEAYTLADNVKDIFENKRISEMRFFETSPFDLGLIEGESTHVLEATTIYEVEI